MSTSPVELLSRGYRRITIPFMNDVQRASSNSLIRSQKLPLPYYIEKITIQPNISISWNEAWIELHVSDSADETAESIVNQPNPIKEISQVARINPNSYYQYYDMILERRVDKEPFIYVLQGEYRKNYGSVTLVTVLLAPETEET